MPPYFNLIYKIHAENNNQLCSTPTKFKTKQKQFNLLWHGTAPGNLVYFNFLVLPIIWTTISLTHLLTKSASSLVSASRVHPHHYGDQIVRRPTAHSPTVCLTVSVRIESFSPLCPHVWTLLYLSQHFINSESSKFL